MSEVSRRLTSLAAVTFLLVAVPAAAQGPRAGLPSRNMLDRFGLERAWSNQATINVRSDVVRHLIADEEVVIVQSRSGLLTVFDAQSGIKLWDGQLARPDQYTYPAVTNGESVFVVIGSTVYARNKFTGDELWTLRLPDTPSTSPTVDESRMYVGMLAGDVYAFDLATIRRNQAENRLPQFRGETILWHYGTSGRIMAPPATNGKIVVFANALGSLYAVSPEERDLRFMFETDDPTSTDLEFGTVVENGVEVSYLYYASGGNNVYCLRTTDGSTRWLYIAGTPVRQKPYVIGDSIFIVPVGAGIHNLDAATGIERWWHPAVTDFLAATPNHIYGTDQAGDIAVLGRSDGGLIGTIPLRGFPIRVRNERTDRLYLCTTSGLVTCIREKDLELPLYLRYPERRPILPLLGDQEPVNEVQEPDLTPEEQQELENGAETLPEEPAE